MVGKLYSLLVLAAVAIACAQTSWDQYIGTVSTGVQGIQQRCFLQHILHDSYLRYRYESIAKDLENDLDEIRESVISEVERNPGTAHCYVYSHCRSLGGFSPREDSSGEELLNAQCFRWAKFGRLCELIKERKSLDKQMLAIEDWVCRVSAEQALGNDYVTEERCMRSVREAAEREADKGFHQVALSTAEELERAKEAVKEEVATWTELKDAHDADIGQEAKKQISERFAKHFSDYKRCFEETDAGMKRVVVEIEKAEAAEKAAKEAAKAARKAATAKRWRGLVGKVSRCFAGSCS